MNGFPVNPEHGTIFEFQPGVYYIYDSSTRSWDIVEGDMFTSVATPSSNGLMSADDFKKLNRLVIPPPQTTITSEQCSTTYSTGIVGFSGDQYLSIGGTEYDFVTIDGTAKLLNVAADSPVDQTIDRSLHLHSHSFNFEINTKNLFLNMIEAGKFRVSAKQGAVGKRGSPGKDGVDEVSYGPDGEKGPDGANAAFPGGLLSETIQFKMKNLSKRAIVKIEANQISENENYLIVTRANIGNPNACPDSVRMGSLVDSTWLVCLPDTTNDLAVKLDACTVCQGEIYYLDIQPLIDEIHNEFEREAERLKKGMENIVTWWLTVMSALYDEQKSALCCALEYCRSQYRNTDTRKYLEQSRIQAAISNHSIILDGDPKSHPTTTDLHSTPTHPACQPDGFGTTNVNGLPNNSDPVGGSYCLPYITKVDGVPRKFEECPSGFTPRSVYREMLLSSVVSMSADEISISSLKPQNLDIISKINKLSKPFIAPLNNKFITNDRKTTNVELRQFMRDSEPSKYDLVFVAALGVPPSSSISKLNAAPDVDLNKSLMHRYYDSLLPGDYFICVVNKSSNNNGFRLVAASRNLMFVGGYGVGWSDDLISSDNLVIRCSQGPLSSNPWWIKFRVLDTSMLPQPYSADCGSVGPKQSVIDIRLCTELFMEDGDPVTRESGKTGGLLSWDTVKIGKELAPDVMSITMTGSKYDNLGKLYLCRVGGGTYTGGFNHDGKSAQIIIEQLSQNLVHHESFAEPESSQQSPSSVLDGSRRFKCTILRWNDINCNDAASEFSTVVGDVDDNLYFADKWNINGETINFILSAEENVNRNNIINDNKLLIISGDSREIKKRSAILLPRGSYDVVFETCCIKSNDEYIGDVAIQYIENGSSITKILSNKGNFKSNESAMDAFKSIRLRIDHDGGEVNAELINPIVFMAFGEVTLKFIELKKESIVTKLQSSINTCQMMVGHLKWIEEGWSIRNCVGAVVEVAGQDYVIVRRDGRLGNIPCLKKYANAAIAWPTIDGKEFFDVPSTGAVHFKHDKELEETVKRSLESGKYTDDVGSLSLIRTIIFPVTK